MQKRKKGLKKVFFITLLSCLLLGSINVTAASELLKIGSQGKSVAKLQKDLAKLGYLNSSSTGYYGTLTSSAVKKLQKKYRLKQDGISGTSTLSLIDNLLGRTAGKLDTTPVTKTSTTKTSTTKTSTAKTSTAKTSTTKLSTTKTTVTKAAASTVSRGSIDRYGYLIPWFGGVEDNWLRGMEAEVLDVETGLGFKVVRSYGSNHADCETLTAEDTAIMKGIFGGQWSWSRRAVIVKVNGRKIAASMAGMPHAGVDNQKGNVNVSGRSGGYGYGVNLDTIKGNNMDGHFDIHFSGSRTHTSNVVDKAHQDAVKRAAEWARDNL